MNKVKPARKIDDILGTNSAAGVRWRVQDARFPLPTTSEDMWNDSSGGYDEGQVSFYAGLLNAVDDMLGEGLDLWGSMADMVRAEGGEPVLVAATSDYEEEDGSGSEVILTSPVEIGRFSLTRRELQTLKRRLEKRWSR